MAQKSQKASAKPAVEVDEIEVPEAKVIDRDAQEPLTRAKVGGFIVVVLGGWMFILGSNKFHVTAPVVFVCLGYLALMFTVVNLWRTGAAAAGPASEDEGWSRPIGARGELEKEKRTLLKGIKEAEFDAAMGKLSKADSESLIRDYRARAIDVIKEIDRLSVGTALSTKDQIEREVRARIALDAQDKPSNRAKKAELAQVKAQARAAPGGEEDDDEEDAGGRVAAMKAKVAAAAAVENPAEVEAAKAKASAEADAIAARVQGDKVALAEAKAAAAQAAAEAAEAKAAAARAAAEVAEAKAAADEAAGDESKGERA